MKALVKFRLADGRNAQKTIEVQKNEPNHIVAELLKQDKRANKYTYINTIKCGRYLYIWKAEAHFQRSRWTMGQNAWYLDI